MSPSGEPVRQGAEESNEVDGSSGAVFQQYIAEQIKYIRVRRGLSQLELAAAAGIDQAQISQFENSRVLPKMNTFFKLIRALDIQPDEFFSDFDLEERRRAKRADASIDIVARNLSQKIHRATRNDDLTRAIWQEYEASRGRKTGLLARLLVKVFFEPKFKKNIQHVNELGEYQKFVMGEMVGFLLSTRDGAGYLTGNELGDEA